MRRRILYSNQNENTLPDGSHANTLDVVFANKNTEKLIITSDWSTSLYPSEEWKPIGIVVIPGKHGILKDSDGKNQCGIMSIVPMNCNTPQTGGSSEQDMYWGVRNDITDLTHYNKVVVTSNKTSNVATGLSYSTYAYIPRQGSVGGTPTRNDYPYAPSPYAGSDYNSGGYNESYGTIKFDNSSNKNALSDFDGPINTQKIIAQRGDKNYASWKPTWYSEFDYPAASCCNMFSTLGTEQGEWYLPSAGELGYIMPKLYDINDTISKLYDAYGVGVQLFTEFYFWSSTEFSSDYAYYVGTYDGCVVNYDKDHSYFVRAFMRL